MHQDQATPTDPSSFPPCPARQLLAEVNRRRPHQSVILAGRYLYRVSRRSASCLAQAVRSCVYLVLAAPQPELLVQRLSRLCVPRPPRPRHPVFDCMPPTIRANRSLTVPNNCDFFTFAVTFSCYRSMRSSVLSSPPRSVTSLYLAS